MRGLIRDLVPAEARNQLRTMLHRGKLKKVAFERFLRRPRVYDIASSERLGVIFLAETHMTIPERCVLYGLVRGLRPERVLEIGTRFGGSASIIAAALEDTGRGCIVGLDPAPESVTPKERYYGRFTLLERPSPEGIAEAARIAGGPFDFVHIDGIVTHRQAKKDLVGALPHLAKHAFILVNNPFHYGVDQAIREFVQENENVFDGGYVSTGIDAEVDPAHAYAGLRLLRVRPKAVEEPQTFIDEAFAAKGKTKPRFRADSINHDQWYCREIEKCEACKESAD